MIRSRTFEVLMVEDDPGDAELTQELLEEVDFAVNVNVVDDGVKAVAYLRHEGDYTWAVRPDLILLDLNLPRKDGREVLQEIKNDHNLKHIPVIILTTSDADDDILKSYKLGASAFITKPVSLEQFTKIVDSIQNFWFTVVKFPPR
jgi:two-component system response regulator